MEQARHVRPRACCTPRIGHPVERDTETTRCSSTACCCAGCRSDLESSHSSRLPCRIRVKLPASHACQRYQAQRGNHTSAATSPGNKREHEGGQGSSGRSARHTRHTRQTVGHLGPASSAISGVTLSQLVSSGLRVSNTCQAHSLPGCISTDSIGALRCISVPERLRVQRVIGSMRRVTRSMRGVIGSR
jgi:hypothetical protein